MFKPVVQIFPDNKEATAASIREAFVQKQLGEFNFCVPIDGNGIIQLSEFSSINMPDLPVLDTMYPVKSIAGVIIRPIVEVVILLLLVLLAVKVYFRQVASTSDEFVLIEHDDTSLEDAVDQNATNSLLLWLLKLAALCLYKRQQCSLQPQLYLTHQNLLRVLRLSLMIINVRFVMGRGRQMILYLFFLAPATTMYAVTAFLH
jgi:hypothetical protein